MTGSRGGRRLRPSVEQIAQPLLQLDQIVVPLNGRGDEDEHLVKLGVEAGKTFGKEMGGKLASGVDVGGGLVVSRTEKSDRFHKIGSLLYIWNLH